MGSVSVARRINGVGTGSSSMTVHGTGMGLGGYTGRGREGQTGCEGTEWESETSVRCLVVRHGVGGTRRVVMTAGERVGSLTQAWSVDMGGLSVGRGGNRAGTGSASMTVQGVNMGTMMHSVRGRVGRTGCEGTEWESSTSVRCLASLGARGTRRAVMTAGERAGSMSQVWSVDAGRASGTHGVNRVGTGSSSVTVHGSGMGLVSYTGHGREGQTGCEGTDWESETSVRCLATHGARGTRRAVMTVGERAGSVSEGWSTDMGGLSVMRRGNGAGTGSASMTVHGSGMGVVGYTARGREGQTGCEGTEWESETTGR